MINQNIPGFTSEVCISNSNIRYQFSYAGQYDDSIHPAQGGPRPHDCYTDCYCSCNACFHDMWRCLPETCVRKPFTKPCMKNCEQSCEQRTE
jgi:hypothetical protein